MKTNRYIVWILSSFFIGLFSSCKNEIDHYDTSFAIEQLIVDGGIQYDDLNYAGINGRSPVRIRFTKPVDRSTLANNIQIFPFEDEENELNIRLDFEDSDKVVVLSVEGGLLTFSKYQMNVKHCIYSQEGILINTGRRYTLITDIDPSDKKPRIPDEQLLDKVQKETFRYFWQGAHGVSGMARERSTSGDVVTTGGTGFGVMAIVVAAERGFITRSEAYGRLLKIVSFLKSCKTYHGAFSHWINGSTGETISFSPTDDGADIVETSFLMQGLLAVRQYFNAPAETQLREGITALWEAVEWSWFNRNKENILYWNWSPNYEWDVNLPVRGWNEALMTYVLAASSPIHSIDKSVYEKGWAKNGLMVNGKMFYSCVLPLGEDYGGPLFFSHYSFLGLNPKELRDNYVQDYWQQTRNHSLIHYKYCIDNPKRYVGYGKDCWGLTASDGDKGYSAHSPTNDLGVIAPTAALASMPYTPEESMAALHYYYYKLGDMLWKDGGYGFYDAFNLSSRWFDNQYLAIDQGPIIVMIENHRSGLIWKLFMEIPEVQVGLRKLGFSSPYLK